MHLSQLLPSLLAVGAALLPSTLAMAEFEQVRKRLAVDQSASDWDKPDKYFSKATK